MNKRPTISERNSANARSALDQYAKALVLFLVSDFGPESQRLAARAFFSRAVLLELLGAK